jgi:Bifunctional DNA primase/polymerase, N-terminal/AAA domain
MRNNKETDVSTLQLTSPVGTTPIRRANDENKRRITNKQNALKYAGIGLYGFLSDGKIPLHPRYNKIDTDLSAEERQFAVAEHVERYGRPPLYVGATRDLEVIKSLFRKYPDGVWSLPTGVNKLVVIDADEKDNGPARIRALFEENGGVPTGVVQVPTKSGGVHFYFSDPDGRFTNKAGSLKSDFGCDVRGVGGQVVAPGTRLEDGLGYGDTNHLHFLRMAVAGNALPALPDYIVKKIGAMSFANQQDIAPTVEREVTKQLEETDWGRHDYDFDPVLCKYDLDALKRDNLEFAALYANPGTDCSTNRFLAAHHLMREWPSMPAPALAIFFSHWEGAGEYTDEKPKIGQYDNRQIAREWIKNQGLSKPSKGEAFGPVAEDPDDVAYERQLAIEHQEAKQSEEKRGMLYLGSDLVQRYQTPDWFVQNMLAPRTVGAISGAPNVGKSFSVLDLGQHLSYGCDWFGLKVERCGVLYAYGEGLDHDWGHAV